MGREKSATIVFPKSRRERNPPPEMPTNLKNKEPVLPLCCGGRPSKVPHSYCGAWSWRLKFFMIFSAYDFGEENLDSAGRHSRKNAVIITSYILLKAGSCPPWCGRSLKLIYNYRQASSWELHCRACTIS